MLVQAVSPRMENGSAGLAWGYGRSMARSGGARGVPWRFVVPPVVALLLLAVFAAAPAASAAPIFGAQLTERNQLTLHPGVADQPAGDWSGYVGSGPSAGDTFTITVDDQDAGPNCGPGGDSIGFAAVPVATQQGGTATETMTIARSSSSAACASASVQDVLTFTLGNDMHGGDYRFGLTGLAYDVGLGVAAGPVRYEVSGASPAFNDVYSNATVSTVDVTTSTPHSLVPTTGASTSVGNVLLAERRPGAIGASGACLHLDPYSGAAFDPTVPPTLSATGGDGSPGTVTATATDISFTATPGTSASTTYTLTGMRVKAPSTAKGSVVVAVGLTCDQPFLNPVVSLARIGDVGRISGANRYATAAAMATALYTTGLSGGSVVVASGDEFPDALAASYYAGTEDVPILLTSAESLPAETISALKGLGATKVTIAGGTAAVSDAVEQQLKGLHAYAAGSNTPQTAFLSVTRLGGADRYATAAALATAHSGDYVGRIDLGVTGTTCQPVKTAIVASGETYPDAVAAGGLAWGGAHELGCGNSGGGLPLLLTTTGGLSSAASSALTTLGISQVLLMGGTASVSSTVESQLAARPGMRLLRIGGTDRQDTAAKLAHQVLLSRAGWGQTGAFLVVRPDTFPDALAGALLSGARQAPVFLAASPTDLGSTTANAIATWGNAPYVGVLLGGTASLNAHVLDQVTAALANPG